MRDMLVVFQYKIFFLIKKSGRRVNDACLQTTYLNELRGHLGRVDDVSAAIRLLGRLQLLVRRRG